MYWLITRFGIWLFRTAASLRYRVKMKGFKDLRKDLDPTKGTLFLPNHPAHIDPVLLVTRLWPKYRVRPMVAEHVFFLPAMHKLFVFCLKAVPVPGFDRSSNSYKRMRSEKALEAIVEGLRNGENFVVYPSGRLKKTADERVGGASLVFEILRQVPNCNIVLVRTKGLWGSMFSWALTGRVPSLGEGLKQGFRILLKNGIFFAPRRKVAIEFQLAPSSLTTLPDRRSFNQALEKWYNEEGEELLTLVSYSRFAPDFPKVKYQKPIQEISVDEVPIEIRRKVTSEIARLSKRKISDIRPEMHLFTDLGLDSLDIADLITALEQESGLKGQAWDVDLFTVGSIMLIMMGKIERQEPSVVTEAPSQWKNAHKKRPPPQLPEGQTLLEAFLRICDRFNSHVACADEMMGVLTYRQLKKRALIVSQLLRRMPGKHIGIMLPSTVVVEVLILACYFAEKIPVMLNWTLGSRYLSQVRSLAKMEAVISSWSFLDRLDGADLTPLHDILVPLESLTSQLHWKDLWRAHRLSKASFENIALKGEDEAVLLFTSGTEAFPKAVSLSHSNLLANHRAALETLPMLKGESFCSILPPFHSLGFSVTGLLPLLAGVMVVYAPDPTDAQMLARVIEKYRPTILPSAPTFLRSLFATARPGELSSLRIVVSGAEKAPPELRAAVEALHPPCIFLEGYGITECSPIVTFTRYGHPAVGVGQPLKGVELLIVDPETHQPLKQGEVGLILTRGPNVFSGYLDSALPSPFVTIEQKQWYVTGDLGSLDPAENLLLAGRLKRFVKVGGEMLSLPALEEVLLEASQQEHWGEGKKDRLLAVIAVEEEGHRPSLHLFANYSIDLERANEVLRQKGFSSLAKLTATHHLPAMPLMGTGKIDYRNLKEQAHEAV
ncbi:MAG: AMP-binding protein [Verrucomicrobia bacterium]|nr:AMP-binding protein [Verrucomicrobiota bacterium]